jgi:hypothetical protein
LGELRDGQTQAQHGQGDTFDGCTPSTAETKIAPLQRFHDDVSRRRFPTTFPDNDTPGSSAKFQALTAFCPLRSTLHARAAVSLQG